MLTHPTLDTLRALKLDGMAEAFTELQTQDGTADLTHAEWLGLLIDREAISRETKRFESRMRTARLRHVGAAPEDVDYKTRRGLDKALFQNLLSGKWIKDKRNLMITGPCGVGKTWLACALAQAACRDGVTVLYKRTTRLFDELELAHGDGRFPRVFKALTKTQLLILDDWGPERLNASQRRDLMEIVEDRYGNGSILITSQLPTTTWHDVIGEPTFASFRDIAAQCTVGQWMPSSIGWCTTPTASNSTANRSERRTPKRVTKRWKTDTNNSMPHGNASKRGGYPGTGGRML